MARAPTDISDSIEPVAVASCATRRPTGATPELPVRRTNPPPSSGGVRAAVRAARRGLEPNTPAAETSSDRTLPRPVIVAGGEQRLTRRNTATSSTQPRRAARPAASRKRSARSRRARARRVASYRKRTRRNRRHARGRAYRRRCYRAGVLVRRGRKYVVRRGDTLWRIARRHYGRGIKYHRIFRANRRKIRNPHLIYPCQRFRVPRR
ncbi:MAG: LysM peptidoglycan-binding domain-containing protein [Pseudomonadota bacterium]